MDNVLGVCWDRVNFHKKTGGDTEGVADPIWPKKTGCSIPSAMMLGSECGNWPGGW